MLRKSKIILGLCLAASLFVVAGLILVLDIFTNVPDFTTMRGAVKVPIRLANGEKSTKMMGPEAPGWVPLSAMSKHLPNAVIASEDTAFFSHDGIDIHEIREAIKKDLKEKKMARGASTLTQQVLKNVFLGSQKTIWRKIKEIFWAREIEKVLTKKEILAFYLNMAEWGPGMYGIGQASRHYFSVPPSYLTERQSAFLAMLLPSPRRYSAYFRTKQLTNWASKRVNRILSVMRSMNFIDDAQYQIAMNENLWNTPTLPDSAPGASDPGFLTDAPDEDDEEAPVEPRRTLRPGLERHDSSPPPAVGATPPSERPPVETAGGIAEPLAPMPEAPAPVYPPEAVPTDALGPPPTDVSPPAAGY